MSGNVAEWVEGNAGQTDAAFALGGAFDSGAENASCSSSLPLAKQNQPGNRVGFRCCKNLKFSENR
jgi:formylglycine-generating enzyme required for sulfatase activity